jgi:predicted Zn-dependent peptidase
MPVYTDPVVKETVVRHRLRSGLEVAVIPRKGQRRTYATFTAHYGSIDNRFRLPDTGEVLEVPDGIAHFLEHKMFEQPGGDVFDDFARLGASANAYTEYLTTTYLFSTTAHVDECLEILLNFVQEPYFTEQNVEKEKGIIEQEIRMYLDMPGDRLHSNLMRALYQRHPVRLDIAGSVESIRTITPEILYRCYETFYHPSNMLLLVIGDVDPAHVIDRVTANQAPKNFQPQGPIPRLMPQEPPAVAERRVERRMAVALPLLAVGYKDPVHELVGPDLLRRELVTGLMWQMLLGKSSPLFARLYEAGLINDRFQARYTAAPTFAHSVLAGETPDPEALFGRLADELPRAALTPDALERAKRRERGEYVGLFDNPGELAYVYNSLYFRQIDLFAVLDVLERVTLADIEERRAEHVREELRATSIVWPEDAPGPSA